MTAIARSVPVSTVIAGDPLTLGPEVVSAEDMLRRCGLESVVPAGVLSVAPGVALVHALPVETGGIELRWFHLPHGPALLPGQAPVHTALLLTTPMSEIGRALRVVATLMACVRDPGWMDATGSATTREALVRMLSGVEANAGESPFPSAVLLALLGSTPTGLTASEAARRLAACGANRIERIAGRPLLLRLADQFTSFFAVLLWVGGAFAFPAGLPELGWAIFGVIVINGVFSFLQEYRAEQAVEALQDLLPREITVLRDGEERRVPAADLVPGDVGLLEEGDHVPADGQLLRAAGLRVDQSALTGESHPVFKLADVATERAGVPRLERHELVFAGTGVVAGAGAFVVTASGMTTEIGNIAQLTQALDLMGCTVPGKM